MRSTSGQATIDYVALGVVVAVVFGLALGLATEGAAGIVNAVVGQIRHALCVVSGGPCADPRSKPCTVASTRDHRHFAVNLFVVRLDDDRSVLREQLSDRTVRLTVVGGGAAGLEGGVGATARVSVKGRPIGATDELRAGAQLTLGSGRVYVARDAREADAFMRAIRDGRSPAPAREVFYDGGVRGLAAAGVGSAWIEGLAQNTIGARRDRRTGEVTVALNAGGSGWGAVTAALGGPTAAADRTTTLGLTLDRHRRATELSLSAAGTIAAGASLPATWTRALGGEATVGAMAGRRWELGARLNLLDPVVRATWARFRRHPASPGAIRALVSAIRERAYLDLRTYRTDSVANGIAGGLAAGGRIGGEYDHTVDRARLLAASSRPPAGLWERRLDCVPA
ncbi:MAG: hypothetical protein QOG42_1002 [Solirubrobacteraceae bacterium]|jgi:hypothetical protein|nr:hypothetical protein [Solirubrobacteraceae bacterium]